MVYPAEAQHVSGNSVVKAPEFSWIASDMETIKLQWLEACSTIKQSGCLVFLKLSEFDEQLHVSQEK